MAAKKNSINKPVSSRNKNKNKNRNLQNKVKERELLKKEKSIKRELSELANDEVEVKAIIIDTPLRDNVVVVPERRVVIEDEDDDPNFVSIDIEKFRFEEEDDGVDKFFFVGNEEEPVVEKEEELEEFIEYSNVEEKPYEEIEQIDRKEDEVETISLDEEIIPRPTDNIDINARRYFSFENRIIILLLVIIVSFFIAGLFVFKAVTHTSKEKVLYNEESSVDYEVCINDEDSEYYSEKCLDSDMEYLSGITERIPVTFGYEAEYNQSVSTEIGYYVVSKINIYREKQGKKLNTTEEVLVERTDFEVFGRDTSFAVDIDVPFDKYNDFVEDYDNNYGIDSYSELEIVFYIDDGNVIKEAGTIVLPLTSQTFSIQEKEISNINQILTLGDSDWSSINTSYGVVGIIFVLFGTLGIIRLTNLVFKVMSTSSLYQRKLNKILREYDKYIVISHGDYEVDSSKRLIKVVSFSELLDARNALEKPIIYVKVNNVKSEFYVEDSESTYKYTLKEGDLEGK